MKKRRHTPQNKTMLHRAFAEPKEATLRSRNAENVGTKCLLEEYPCECLSLLLPCFVCLHVLAILFQVVGQAYVYLETIRSLLPIEKEPFPVFDSKGQKKGTLVVSVDIQVGPPRTYIEGYISDVGGRPVLPPSQERRPMLHLLPYMLSCWA